jgi:hypothetical protein
MEIFCRYQSNIYICNKWGCPGIDWRLYDKWARSRMSSTTLIYGGNN